MKKKKPLQLGDIIWLDLDKVDLFGWEDLKYASKLAKMVRDIEKGDEFPEVLIAVRNGRYALSGRCEVARNKYGSLTDNYGGHHRAVAHYIAGMPLKCKITPYKCIGVRRDVKIKDIVIHSYAKY